MKTLAHQLLWTGISGLDAAEVKGPHPGGIVLFGRNLDPDPERGPERCHDLIRALQLRWGRKLPLVVAVDQEGGTVSRLKPWVGETPTFHHLWEKGGTAACERWGRLWGRGLSLLGIHVDFAPVADLWDGNPGTGLGNRCASKDVEDTAKAVGAFLFGLESTGVRGCLKHFPGLGGTRVDSHKELPALADEEQIRRNLQPFRALAHADRLIMVAHLKLPATEGIPTSLHKAFVLANPWGLRGHWIPDDLEMGGCSDWDWNNRVRLCLEAGHEALLVCQTPEGIAACAGAAARIPSALLIPALTRFNALRASLPVKTGDFDRKAWITWLDDFKSEIEND
jgi:beta-N-acetylhexosaminidase